MAKQHRKIPTPHVDPPEVEAILPQPPKYSLEQAIEVAADKQERLLKAIERSIEELGEGTRKEGWNSFAVLSAIAAAIVGFLGYSSKVQFNLEVVKEISTLSVSFVILGHVLLLLGRIQTGQTSVLKPRRFMSATLMLRHKVAPAVVRLLTLTSIELIILGYFETTKLTSFALIVVPILAIPYVVTIFSATFPMAKFRPSASQSLVNLGTIVMIGLYVILFVISCSAWIRPFGEQGSAIYGTALTVSASMVLFEFWLNSLPNPQFLRNLKELRDDLLFERVNYEEGLTAYRLLVEGYSLRDLAGPVVQKMFSIVDNLELRERKTVSLLAVLENEVSGDIDDWTPERIRKCIEGLGSIEHVVDEQLSELAEFGECIENLSAETASNSHKINSADQTTMLAVEFGARLDSMSAAVRGHSQRMGEMLKQLPKPKAAAELDNHG